MTGSERILETGGNLNSFLFVAYMGTNATITLNPKP